MQSLAEEFHDQLLEMYRRVVAGCAPYNPHWFLQMVVSHGGVNAAKRLLISDVPQPGFVELWEQGRLDLTLEAHVLLPRYAELFTDQELREAENRLRSHGNDLDPG